MRQAQALESDATAERVRGRQNRRSGAAQVGVRCVRIDRVDACPAEACAGRKKAWGRAWGAPRTSIRTGGETVPEEAPWAE